MLKQRLRSKDERPHRHVGPAPSAPAAPTCGAYTSHECSKVPDSSSSPLSKKISQRVLISTLVILLELNRRGRQERAVAPSGLLLPAAAPSVHLLQRCVHPVLAPRVMIPIHGSGDPEPHPPLVRRLQPPCTSPAASRPTPLLPRLSCGATSSSSSRQDLVLIARPHGDLRR
jgi:hypothetical protein